MASMGLGRRIGYLRGEARQREVDLVLARWHGSALGQGRFCREEGLSTQSLRRWLVAKGAAPSTAALPPAFIEVPAPTPPSDARYEITLSCGARVLIPMGFDEAEVARLLSLAAAC